MRFLATYRATGGLLDEIVQDSELNAMKSSALAAPNVPPPCALARWDAVSADRRWPALLKELSALGFDMASNGSAFSTEHPLAAAMGWPSPIGASPLSRNQVIWNILTQRRMSSAWSQAYYMPARRLFPAVKASDFDHYSSQPSSCADGVCFPNGYARSIPRQRELFGSGRS